MEKLWLISLLLLTHCKAPEGSMPPYYTIDPLSDPMVFAEGQIETTNGIAFSKDGRLLYSSSLLESAFEDGRKRAGLFVQSFEDGSWSEAMQVNLGPKFDAYHPVLSLDNTLLYFNSRSDLNRPEIRMPHNIWCTRKMKNGWSKPQMVEEVNSEYYDSYPAVAGNGNLYFNSDRLGGKGGMDIYVSYFQNGALQKPINLDILNSVDAENDLVIAADETFIIFNRYIASTNEIDLYMAKRKGGEWQSPSAIHHINKPGQWELTPSLSPDGKYFFYELDQKIMQVDLSVLLDH